MPADQASQTSCYILVDGRKVMEMQDADAAPRDWEWLRRRPREKSDMVERTTASTPDESVDCRRGGAVL